jgi:hypothetical protein
MDRDREGPWCFFFFFLLADSFSLFLFHTKARTSAPNWFCLLLDISHASIEFYCSFSLLLHQTFPHSMTEQSDLKKGLNRDKMNRQF